MSHSIRNAGLGLSFLYMTVLGFDNITYGFCLAQCVTEWVLGLLVGVSAIFGVIGSLSFPYLRKRIGLARTGMVGMIALCVTLSLCVISIWLDGSPFDPSYYNSKGSKNETQYHTTERSDNYKGLASERTSVTNLSTEIQDCLNPYFLSVSFLLAGMILARYGLWISDLTITQIIQESYHYTFF